MVQIEKGDRLTRVLQKLGFSDKLNIWNSNEHYAKFEHSYFDFPAFAKPETVSGNFVTEKRK